MFRRTNLKEQSFRQRIKQPKNEDKRTGVHQRKNDNSSYGTNGAIGWNLSVVSFYRGQSIEKR